MSCGHGALKIGIMTLFTDDSSHFEVNTMKFLFVVGIILIILGFFGIRIDLFPQSRLQKAMNRLSNGDIVLTLMLLLGVIFVVIGCIWWSLS